MTDQTLALDPTNQRPCASAAAYAPPAPRRGSPAAPSRKQVLPLDPARYQPHAIHGRERIWAETNCYVDVWIELLHAWGCEPIAALPFTLAIDFEGDQWTFFKFPLADLYRLYGLDVQELALWRSLVHHVDEQLALGRPVLVELDSYYLPDTSGTAYGKEHVKTTVAVNEIDLAEQRLGYFHNQGYFQLHGSDFVNIFHLAGPMNPAILPPYAEFVKRQPVPRPECRELAEASAALLHHHLRLVPRTNPFERFKTRFQQDLEWLTQEALTTFHQYSFATLRQFGACYELAATYLHWLQEQRGTPFQRASAAFRELATAAKALQFQLARSVARKKPLDLSALETMAATWGLAQNAVHDAHR